MKPLYTFFAAALLLGPIAPSARAEAEISLDFFYDNLESEGNWREVGDYGYCWQPSHVDADWRPYRDGRWDYTDAGWTWDSDETFGWAVYHYGRWAEVERIGWVWVPDTEWGPAWVSWRNNDKYVGWAPLPPEARFQRTVGISDWADSYYDIGPSHYSFVEVRNFGSPRLRSVIVRPRENITIINQTVNITKITYVNNVVYNGGPQYDSMVRVSADPIRRLRLERRRDFDGNDRSARPDQFRSRVEGDSLRIFAPAVAVDARPVRAPRKVEARVEKVEVDRGWKNAGPAEEVAKVRTKLKTEAKAPAELPPQPKFEKASAPAATTPKSGAEAPVDPKTAKERIKKGEKPEAPIAPVNAAQPAEPKPAGKKPDAPERTDVPGKPGVHRPGAERPDAPAKPDDTIKPERPAPAEKPDAPSKPGKPRQPEPRKKPDTAPPVSPAPNANEPGQPTPPIDDPRPGKGRKPGNTPEPRKPSVAPDSTPETPERPGVPPEPKRPGKVQRPVEPPPVVKDPPAPKHPDREPKNEPKRELPPNRPEPEAKKPEGRPPAAPHAEPRQPELNKGQGKGKNKDDKKPDDGQ